MFSFRNSVSIFGTLPSESWISNCCVLILYDFRNYSIYCRVMCMWVLRDRWSSRWLDYTCWFVWILPLESLISKCCVLMLSDFLQFIVVWCVTLTRPVKFVLAGLYLMIYVKIDELCSSCVLDFDMKMRFDFVTTHDCCWTIDLLYLELLRKHQWKLLVWARLAAGEQQNPMRMQLLPFKALASQLIAPRDLFRRSRQSSAARPNSPPSLK